VLLAFISDSQKDFNMKKHTIFIITAFLMLINFGCNKRLDDFLFNGSPLEKYLLDDFDGEVSLDVPFTYFVPDNRIHQFSYPILSEGEQLNIAAIYTGDTNRIATDTIILYCHGNRDHMDFYWPRQKLYSHIGHPSRFGVLMIDYPGFGMSTGKSTEQNMYDAVDGAMGWLAEKGLTEDRLIIFGFSLGSAPACMAAAGEMQMTPHKVILEAPFASAEIMIQDATHLAMPGSFLVNLKIANAEKIRATKAPLLWIHGEKDDFLAIDKHGEIVYNNHGGPWKIAERVPGGGHETTPVFMGFENYLESLLRFITEDN
jgi:pimeloyl-ACP methyl ester carboxylesterase